MKVLSLFDGFGGAKLAITDSRGVIEDYYAAELDPAPAKIASGHIHNYINFGDVENWRAWPIDWGNIDMVIGGSPCQGFSNTGKRRGFDDPRSKLFWVFDEIRQHVLKHNPYAHFMLENVQMREEWSSIITDALGVPMLSINASECLPVLRARSYWASWKPEKPALTRPTYMQNLQQVVDGCGAGGYADRETSFCIPARYLASMGRSTLAHAAKGNFTKTFIFDSTTKPKYARCLTINEMATLHGIDPTIFAGHNPAKSVYAIGNGWAIPVVTALLQQLLKQTPEPIRPPQITGIPSLDTPLRVYRFETPGDLTTATLEKDRMWAEIMQGPRRIEVG